MRQNETSIKIHKVSYFLSGISLFLSLILVLSSRNINGFAEWYAKNIYPYFLNTFSRVFSGWNFSFFELGILLSFLMIGFFLLKGIWIITLKKSYGKAYFYSSIRYLICLIAGLVLIYTLTCAINYQREDIGTVMNLPDEKPSKEKLEKLSEILVQDLTSLTNDKNWEYSSLTADDFAYIETEAVNSMKQLGKQESSLAGYYPRPKRIYFSETLSKLGIEGIYSPFTMEANYNTKMTPFLIPYTISHELAHLKGYMKEDDAGFIAYLACKRSPSKLFQYSGAFHALNFTLSALKSEVSTEEFNFFYQKLPQKIRIQLSYIKEQNMDQPSSLLSIRQSCNNLYLKANAQSEGENSYDRMVDLLLAEYADRLDPENMI